MKKNIIYLSAVLIAILFSACERVEDMESPVFGKLEAMSFSASIVNDAETKTMIEGNVGDDVRCLKWQPNDTIGIYNSSSGDFQKFVNVNTESSSSAVFEGENTRQDVYYAVYPYSKSHSFKSDVMTIDLPSVQNYAVNSFADGANPMVAHSEEGEELMFQNLCGVLVINLTGDVSVRSMSVTLADGFGDLVGICGKHEVSMNYVESPTIRSTVDSYDVITLDCGDGVVLNASEPTPFHIVIPAGTYGGVNITVLTTDGQIMIRQSKNDLNIKRSRIISAGVLEYKESISIDLSERGTSNCYIVSESGSYSFDASVIGNGEFGLVPNAGFHADSPDISPSSVELLWEDTPGVVQSVWYKDGRIGFYSSGIEGNALLAAKDASGTIIWSWHIWVTDKPEDHVYVNEFGEFTVMDRHIGALSNSRGVGDQWKHSVGTYYQWGRKDPLIPSHYAVVNKTVSIKEANAAPSTFFYLSATWMLEENKALWSPEYKTVYDPCPVGYKIATQDIWSGFFVSGDNDKGLYLKYDGDERVSWYPASSWIDTGGSLIDRDYESYVWAAEYKENLHFSRNTLDLTSKYQPSNGFNVRCMKDDGYVDISFPQVQIVGFEDVTMSSAKVVVNVKSSGVSDVTEKGIIWGTAEDLSGGIKIKCGSGADEYVAELTELDNATKYYVRPYAVNSRGETLGSVKSFTTKYSDSEVDLSSEGTANSYMVGTLGMYSFDCTVKGNSNESVGVPSSVQVLWETDNTSVPVSSGYIVSEVNLIEGGRVVFEASGNPGNALIAVKDADETILWSWHIWSTDIPKDQVYKNQTDSYIVMDRNLGALRSDRGEGDQWKESQGLLYQWGRKDPFADGYIVKHNAGMSVEESVMMPTSYYTGWSPRSGSWSAEKTIHDPCPPGYRVPDLSVLEGFTATGNDTYDIDQINVRGNFDFGWNFIIDDAGNTAWYPATYHMGAMGIYEHHTDIGYIWTADGNLFEYRCNSNETYVMIGKNTGKYQGFSVRCMKE